MPRSHTFAAAALLAAVCAFSGAAVATADAPRDACESVYKTNDVDSLKRYDACRFDRIDAKLDALSGTAPTSRPTASPTASSRPPSSPAATSQATSQISAPSTTSAPATGSAATRILGPTRSGLPWHSGAWLGGRFNVASIEAFGAWRGRPADVVTTYAPRDSYATMTDNTWSIGTWTGFAGRLNYGLSPLPDDGEGSLASIGSGAQDAVWTKIARNLQDAGRGDSIVRVGWESNLKDWRWHVTSSNAAEFKAAFRRIVTTMRAEAPNLKFEFGVGCGSGLNGSSDRLAPLTRVYPGDDVVDLVGCDTYDWLNTHPTDAASWAKTSAPDQGPGVADIVAFARAHGKGASFGEWGLAETANGGGGGDNPFFINTMYDFFYDNRDVVAFECYFDESDSYLVSSIFGSGQNPNAAVAYRNKYKD